MTNTEAVLAFIASWEARDVDAIVEAFADEPVYHNIPMDPLTSKEAIRAFTEPFLGSTTAVEWQVKFIAENADGVVLTERVDIFHFGPKALSIRVMGSFELEGGKIKRWRDYFDLAEFQQQMAAVQG